MVFLCFTVSILKEKIMPVASVKVRQSIEANWTADTEPGFRMEINADYRNLPDEALLQLEKTLANGIQQMAEYGERMQAASLPK